MPRLVILGRTGQLATELIRQAPAQGWDAVALGRDVADFADPQSCVAALGAALPADAVINAAAYTAVDRAESEETLAHTINAQTPGQLAALCAAQDIPFVHSVDRTMCSMAPSRSLMWRRMPPTRKVPMAARSVLARLRWKRLVGAA